MFTSCSSHEWSFEVNCLALTGVLSASLKSGMGVQFREATNVPKLSEPQHHRSQPIRHLWLPVSKNLLVENCRGLSGGERNFHCACVDITTQIKLHNG